MNLTASFAAALLALGSLAYLAFGDKKFCGIRYSPTKFSELFFEYECREQRDPNTHYNQSVFLQRISCNAEKPQSHHCPPYGCGLDRRAPYFDRYAVDDPTTHPFAGNYTARDVIAVADTNQDGKLDEDEVKIFAKRHGLPDDDSWRALDADGDNRLTAQEIDQKLVTRTYSLFVAGQKMYIMLIKGKLETK